MRIRRGKARFEQVLLSPDESFVVRNFHQLSFDYGWHAHPELELTLIVKGRGLRGVGDSLESYEPGDLCLLGSGLPHSWQSDPADGSVESIVIQFMGELFTKTLCHLPELGRIAPLLSAASRGLQVTAGTTRDTIDSMMRQIVRAPDGGFQRVTLLVEMLATLAGDPSLRPLSAISYDERSARKAQGVIGKVLERVHDENDEDKSQSRMAKIAGLSPQSFSRFFKSQLGRPYVDYVNEWRISRACRLLAETDQDITAIAFDVGFNNLSNFNRRFRQIKGLRPREYRAKVAESVGV